MKQNNDDFEDYERSVWKPIAQQQILDGYRKFWGLASKSYQKIITQKIQSQVSPTLHLILLKKEMPQGTEYNIIEDEFLKRLLRDFKRQGKYYLPKNSL